MPLTQKNGHPPSKEWQRSIAEDPSVTRMHKARIRQAFVILDTGMQPPNRYSRLRLVYTLMLSSRH